MECTSPVEMSGVQLPCGQCGHCRRNRASEWKTRLMNELEYWTDSCFLTLTYSDEELPEDESLEPEELTLFIKRFRKEVGVKIKYYAVGEYGEEELRPHYHMIVFGIPYDWQGFVRLFPAATDEKLKGMVGVKSWTHGFAHVGTVTRDSIEYVTGYVTKALTGPLATEVYGRRELPFSRQSTGLGKQFVQDNQEELLKTASIQSGSAQLRLPRYYKKKLGIADYTISKVLEDRALMAAKVKRATYIHRSGSLDPEILREEERIVREQNRKNLRSKQNLRRRDV